MPSKPLRVYTLTDKKPVPFQYKDGVVSVTVKRLDEYEAVVLGF